MAKAIFKLAEQEVSVEVQKTSSSWTLDFLEQNLSGEIVAWSPPCFEIKIAGELIKGYFFRTEHAIDVHLPEGNYRLSYVKKHRGQGKSAANVGELTAPMPGKVLKVMVAPGDVVKQGEALMVLEAMKMEHQIKSPLDGEVAKVFFQEGDRVTQDEELLEIKAS